MKNKLRIRAKSLNLDLAGEADYVLRAYDAIHPVLLERFEESVEGVLDGPDQQVPDGSTMRMHAATPSEAAVASPSHLNVVICNEVYHKIHLVERERVDSSIFARSFDFENVTRVYINRSQRDAFRTVFPQGKVLWRELTAAGKAVVKGT